jgi:hypothetical protein
MIVVQVSLLATICAVTGAFVVSKPLGSLFESSGWLKGEPLAVSQDQHSARAVYHYS